MARPKKIKKLEQEIDAELGNGPVDIAVIDPEKIKPETNKHIKAPKPAANDLPEEYTLQVDQDYDQRGDVFRIPAPDTRYQYRWLNSSEKNLALKRTSLLFRYGGWQLATAAHGSRIGRGDTASADDHCRIGDHILAFMPKDLYEKKLAAKKAASDAQIDDINRRTKADQSVGGSDTHSSMKGLRRGKMDGGRVVFDP